MIRSILERGTLDVVFQPIRDLETENLFGYEALGRLRTAASPFPGPPELLARAHREGLLHALDLGWRRSAIERIAAWDPGGSSGLRWFLNVDPRCAEQPVETIESTLRLLTEHGLAQAQVVLEVADREPPCDTHRIARLAGFCRDFGLPVALDDFGSSYTPTGKLVAIGPAFVKIDREIVHGVAGDPLRAALVRAIVDLGARTGFRVIAEGIESKLDLAAVRRMGVRFGQGFLLGRPAALPLESAA